MKIRAAAKRALNHLAAYSPYKVQTPVKFDVELARTSMAAAATLITGITRENPRTISFTSADALEGYRMLTAALLTAKASQLVDTR